MEQFFVDYLDRLREVHSEIEKALAVLPPEALDWQPGPEINSASVLIMHLTGAQRYWIGDMGMLESSNRNRDSEFEVRGLTTADLLKRLQATEDYACSACARLSLTDLGVMRSSPHGDEHFTVAWALLHALEHTAIHAGHIETLKQLWQQRT